MAAALDVSAELDRQDMGAVMSAMRRNMAMLGKSLPQSLKFTGWAVADSLRVATKLSPKKRPVREVPKERTRRGNKVFEVERLSSGGRKSTFRVFGKNKREVNKLPSVIIQNRGLAARAWHFAQRKLGSGRGGARVSAKAQKLARRYTSVEMNLRGNNPSITIRNRLKYAGDAFKTSGEQTINNVLERAARRMEKITLAKAAKALGR
jgi:hypothetical protein